MMKRKVKRWQLILVMLLLMMIGVYIASVGITIMAGYETSVHKYLLTFVAMLFSLGGTTVFVMSFMFLVEKLRGRGGRNKYTRNVRKDVGGRETP